MKTVRNDPVKQRMLDFSQCSDLGEAHRAIRRELELPEWYGRNLDALWDSLTGIMYLPAEVTIVYDPNHKDKALAAEIDKVIEVFRDAEVKCPEIVVHVRANETRPQAAAVMGENMKDLQGVFPALITPFDTDGQVNEDALRQLVRLGLRQGVSGFYVGGSSAEAFLLTQEERRRILETVTDEAAGEAAIIAHVGCMSTGQAIELARHAEACGADAVSSVAPFYYPFSFEELKRYYLDILDSCGLPMVVYNFPGASGVSLKLEQMAELVAHPRVIGVKHTSSDYFLLERLRDLRADLLVYNGFDEMFLAGLGMGASGGIGSTYNFMAERFVKIRKLFLENDMQGALAEQKAVNRIVAAILQVGVIPGVKAAVEHLGIAAGPGRRPFRPLSAEQRAWLIGTIFGDAE